MISNIMVSRIFAVLLLAACAACAQQPIDTGYTAKIKEFTTEPFFLTDLVDHLPASATVPTPEKFLGYIAGAPDKLTYAADIHRYLRELEKTSKRIKVFAMGRTEEGREMVVAVVSDEANIARLARLKEITAKLSDPRKLTGADAQKLIAEGLPFYWANGSIHSTETGSPEMLMELAYRLVVEETPFIQQIRKNLVTMITPVVEVDGHEKVVDIYRYRKANPKKPAPSAVYWGRYVAHDNNRDGIVLALALSRNFMKTFLEYHPQVEHDLHESVPYLYISTGMGPYNAWLDPIVINEWQELAWHEVQEMTKRNVPGVWTWGFYDGWASNYLFTAAHGHNAIGRFYETFGNGGGDTRDRTLTGAQTARQWYRPNPPLPRVKWSQRNNVNLQQSGVLLALNNVATQKEKFLRNFWLKGQRSVAKATAEGPAAYVISAAERPAEAASLVELLQSHAIEVHRLDAGGNYVVRMDQPYSRMADMLLDKQFYAATDTNPYDDTGWTLGPLRNVPTTRVTDKAILKTAMTPLDGAPKAAGQVAGDGPVYLINHNAERVLATLRFLLKDVKMEAAEDKFEAGGRKFNAGTFIIKAPANGPDLKRQLSAAAAELGVDVVSAAVAPQVASHALAVPRIALVHSWSSTQTEGWYRLALESAKIPFTYISDHVLRQTANLREKFDVILLGALPGSAQRAVNGTPLRGEPVPFDASVGPNVAASPDTTADTRGGMRLEGLVNVRNFVEQGGLLVAIAANCSIPIDYGLIDGISITAPNQLRAHGSVLQGEIADAKSPVAYGYDDKLALYFSSGPIFSVSTGGGFGAQTAGRVSGRGGTGDADIAQARAAYTPPPAAAAKSGEEGGEMPESLRAFLPRPEERPRTVLRFAAVDGLLVSGLLAGGGELAGKPAVVDAPAGKGHYLLFANNPLWRMETQGSWMLFFNAALNFDNLNAGRKP